MLTFGRSRRVWGQLAQWPMMSLSLFSLLASVHIRYALLFFFLKWLTTLLLEVSEVMAIVALLHSSLFVFPPVRLFSLDFDWSGVLVRWVNSSVIHFKLLFLLFFQFFLLSLLFLPLLLLFLFAPLFFLLTFIALNSLHKRLLEALGSIGEQAYNST